MSVTVEAHRWIRLRRGELSLVVDRPEFPGMLAVFFSVDGQGDGRARCVRLDDPRFGFLVLQSAGQAAASSR